MTARQASTLRPAVTRAALVFAGLGRWASLAAIVLLIFGCASRNEVKVKTPSVRPATAWDSVLTEIGPDSVVSLRTALRAFSLAIGPLPGVQTPKGPPAFIRSGSGALRWVIGHWKELSPQQRAAVKKYLQIPGSGSHIVSGISYDVASTNVGIQIDAKPPILIKSEQSYFDGMADQARQTITEKLGRPLGQTLKVVLNEKEVNANGPALAYTPSYDANMGFAGRAKHCVIHLNPTLVAASDNIKRETIPHEVYHCFEADLFPSVYAFGDTTKASPWLVEGQAEWVGDTIAGSGDAAAGFWQGYLLHPETRLFKRSYDATGFYAHMENVGINPWQHFDEMLKAKHNETAYARAISGDADNFLNNWASSYVRSRLHDDTMDPAIWDMTGPGITSNMATMPVKHIGDHQKGDLSVSAYSNGIMYAVLEADVIHIAASSLHGRMNPSDHSDLSGSALNNVDYCTLEKGCTCPQGTARTGPALPHLASGTAYVAMTGANTGASVTLTGRSLDDFCKPRPSPPPIAAKPVDPCSLIDAGTAGILGANFVVGPAPSSLEPGTGCAAWGATYGPDRLSGGWVLVAIITPDDLRRRANGVAATCMQFRADTVSKCHDLLSKMGSVGTTAVKNGVLIMAGAIHKGSKQSDLATSRAVLQHALKLMH